MQELINNLIFILQRFTWSSVLDVVLVTIIFALVLYFLRDTEAQNLIRGIFLVIILITLLTTVVNLPAFTWMVNTFTPALILVIPVIFAPEIRRALERVGRLGSIDLFTRRKSGKSTDQLEMTLQAIVKAAVQLSERRHGALIVLRRQQYLDQYYKNGVMLNAEVTPQLLMQIFYPNSPLHDGAVIIDNNRIKAASCVMPLSSSGVLNSSVERSVGLRHRAALGISEVSDAIAVVVSEETGTISIAHRGRLIRRLDAERLANSMRAFLTSNELLNTEKAKGRLRNLFTKKRKKTEEEQE